MEPTPLPPLVSDAQITWRSMCAENGVIVEETSFNVGAYFIRDIYEADRQRTREVVQALVDGIETMRQGSFADAFIFASDADLDAHADRLLSIAKSINIEPKP